MSGSVRVTVPATSANLGPGFDALGLALELHDVVEADMTSGGIDVQVTGIGAGELPLDEKHLVVRAMRATFTSLGAEVAGLRVKCTNTIPHARGLGSSAAAITAGVLAARALAEAPDDTSAALAMAADLEGHPDNVASCLLGGLTIAWPSSGRAMAVTLDVHPEVRPVVFVPGDSLSTEAARGLLPASVPHAAAARNAGRAALLVEALTRRPELLLDATADELHQPYRAPAMQDTLALVKELREHDIAAVVSGAGPSVLALAIADQRIEPVPGWQMLNLAVERRGAVATRADGTDSSEMVAGGV